MNKRLAATFAHLLGKPHSAKAAENDDDQDPKKQRAEESDEDYAKRMEDDDKKEKEAKKAEDDKKKEDAEKDCDDEEMKGDTPEAQARARERERCAAIFMSPAAGKCPNVAARLAFGSTMSRIEAIAMLEETAASIPEPVAPAKAGARATLDDRMRQAQVPNPGASVAGGLGGGSGDKYVAEAKSLYDQYTAK